MSFIDTVRRARDLLREEGRVTLRGLKREFDLDDDAVEELVEELVDAQRVATREGKVVSWVGARRAGEPAALPVVSPPAEPEAERRQLTVLFCDLVGSTRLAAGLDPEDWREVVRGYQQSATEVVERFDGHVAQYLGDGLMVYFGWPRAHEDDAERAVRAGLGIADALAAGDETHAARHGVELAVRIGIHTGPVVVGEMGGGASRETLAMGDTINIAARLQGEAEPDSVLISAATLRLVQGLFLTREIGLLSLKGIDTPVVAHRAVRVSGVRSRLDLAAAGALTPLVGRERELGLLEEGWARARAGMGQALVISGEPGIGKSRIVEAFRERLAETPHTWLECRCSAYAQDSAFLPVIELLDQALAIRPEATREEKLAQLANGLGFAGFDVAESLPLVTELLSLPPPEGYVAPASTPEARRRRTLALLAEWLLRLGRHQPVVLLVEDLHWVDPSTRELLAMILEQVPTASVLALYTHRLDFDSPWADHPHVTPILLPRLTRSQAREMVRGAARGGEISEAWLEEITRRTDGVPLFVEELTRTLLESEALAQERRAQDTPYSVSIPATLQDSLMARLDQLGAVKEVAQLAACLGREFSFELLLAVSPLAATELAAALGKAVKADLFYQRGTPPECAYLFKHALIQEAAYESLLRASRQRYHKRIAETLEKVFPEVLETRPELVGHHYAEGGAVEPAVECFRRAGQRAIERSAPAEAVRHLGRALDLLGDLPADAARDGCELGLQTLLGLGLVATDGYGSKEVERAFGRAEAICRELGDSEALFPILNGHWLFHLARADAEQEFDAAQRLLTLSERANKTELEIQGNLAMGITLCFRGELERSVEHLERALTRYEPARHGHLAFAYGQDPAAYASAVLAEDLLFLGQPKRALETLDRAMAHAERVGHPFTLAGILAGFATQCFFMSGDHERCLEVSGRGLSLSEEHGFPFLVAVSEFYWAWAELAAGERGALARMVSGLEAIRSTGALRGRTVHLCMLAEGYHRAGRATEGLAVVQEASIYAEKHHEYYWTSEIQRWCGELLLLDGDETAAEPCFRSALRIAREQGARSFELRAAMSLAHLRRRQGKRDEARDLIRRVYDRFAEGSETRDLRDARALLEEPR